MISKQQEHYHRQAKLDIKHSPSLIDCPVCHTLLTEDDINDKEQIANCHHCNHVFSYEDVYDPFEQEDLPVGVDLLQSRTFMDLEVSWVDVTDKASIYSSLGFSAIWNSIVLFFIINIISSGTLLPLLFVMIHLTVGVNMMRAALKGLLNKTIFRLDGAYLEADVKPINGFRKREWRILLDDLVKITEKSGATMGRTRQLVFHLKDGSSETIELPGDRKSIDYIKKKIFAFKENRMNP